MDIGIPREIKAQEGRVALLPAQVESLVAAGRRVWVERGTGRLSGAEDRDYEAAGGELLNDAAELYARSQLIVKVKEILPEEYGHLRRDQVVLTNLHTALNRELTDKLLEVGLIGISAEETHASGSPNSPLAGEVGALEGVRLCLAPHGGTGRHFMAHYGAPALRAVVIGLGGVGQGALRTLTRLGCSVTGLDLDPGAWFRSELIFSGHDFTAESVEALPRLLPEADMVVNCVLWDKQRSDHLITRAMLKSMKPTAVLVDISCDTAGAIETSRPTTWADPVYVVDGIRHYCVDNIPGAVPATASAGYARALLPFVERIAALGPIEACRRDPWLARGLTCAGGTLLLEETGRLQDRPFTPVETFLKEAG
jgi:alanine dehydrogenase